MVRYKMFIHIYIYMYIVGLNMEFTGIVLICLLQVKLFC